jgi:ABC-type antimicrobial peptide transport system permease subunit
MSSNSYISIKGEPANPNPAYFHSISPEWLNVMKITLIDGRDFRPGDSSPGSAIVNETFAREYFNAKNPIGRSFAVNERTTYQIVGLVKDSPYRSLREPILPVAYLPFQIIDASGVPKPIRFGRFVVRTIANDPLTLAAALRREIVQARPDFRVSNIFTQEELVLAQTIRERLLAMLAIFFAAVAALLAGIGLYGVLDYSVLQRRREIGIRLAIGAQGAQIARLVTREIVAMVVIGAVAGLGLGIA